MDTIQSAQERAKIASNMRPFDPLQSADIGARIAARRKNLHMSQTELAKALQVSRTTLSEYETGKHSISAKEIRVAMRKLSVPLEYFLGDVSLEDVVRGDADFMMIESAEEILAPHETAMLVALGRLPEDIKGMAIRIVEAMYDSNDARDMDVLNRLVDGPK